MYNLNINMATAANNAVNNLLSVESSCTTPRTPEILNSLIAMTNPMDNYSFGGGGDGPPKGNRFQPNVSSDSNSSSCSQESRLGASGGASSGGPTSVERTCSQLIRAGLKLSIEQKRKLQSDSEDLLDLDKVKRIKRNESESEEDKGHGGPGLTPEDEERRRRRRERNKIAATKCRLKKRERTANLVVESETLEQQNIEMKKVRAELESTKRHLEEVLTVHRVSCPRAHAIGETPVFSRLPPIDSYSRPSSVESNYLDGYRCYAGARGLYKTGIIEAKYEDEYEANLTNLDDPSEGYGYNVQQPCMNYTGSQQSYGNQGINGCMA